MHWSEVWFGEGFAPKTLRLVLTPASWLYAAGWNGYRSLYDRGLKKAAHPHRPIVCVGNLTTGGSGKTPFTAFLARTLEDMGFEVVIGCSGYGSSASADATLAPEGALRAAEWGDEAALFRYLLPRTPLIVGRDRVLAAQVCEAKYPRSVLLMDDGLQHLPLEKDLSIVLDPPLSNLRCLPAGPYREPRASAHPGDVRLPGHYRIVSEPASFESANTGEAAPPPVEANVLCAIGSPQNLLESLRVVGVRVNETRLLPDHSTLTNGNLFQALSPDEPLIVTLKDWVKLRERSDVGARNILVARQRISVEPAAEFAEWIRERLHEVVSKGA